MKKLIIILALALPMLAGAETTPKFGYINTQELFALMPELKAAQARMDSLSKQYEDMIMGMREEYNKKEGLALSPEEIKYLNEKIKLKNGMCG